MYEIDAFGQSGKSFLGKIQTADELLSRAAKAPVYWEALRGRGVAAAWNRWGGEPGSGKRLGLTATGFFHVERNGSGKEAGDVPWLLVDPDGEALLHLSACAFCPCDDFTEIRGREQMFSWLPPREGIFSEAWKCLDGETLADAHIVSFYKANVIRTQGRYDTAAESARMVSRAQAAGLNAVGAFTTLSPELLATGFPYVAFLPMGCLGTLPGIRGVFDPYAEDAEAKLDAAMAQGVARHAQDPALIGYFLANEQGYEDLPRGIPTLGAEHACKRALADFLRTRYAGRGADAFAAAWGGVRDWETFAQKPMTPDTRAALADMQAFCEDFLERTYGLVERVFRRHDPNHMLLGSRWQPGTANNEALCRAAGRHMDIVSVNYYAVNPDAAFLRRIHRWCGGRPLMLSEFYYTASRESASGPNGMEMPTQAARGKAYRHYVEQTAALGFVVGYEWFTLIDQSCTGRWFEGLHGESHNTGLLSICDLPYEDCLNEMALTNRRALAVRLGATEPYVYAEDPRFVGKGRGGRLATAGRFLGAPDAALSGSARSYPPRPPERIGADCLVQGGDANGVEGSFRLAWDARGLRLLIEVRDATPCRNLQHGGHIWNGDCIELFLSAEEPEADGALRFGDRQILLSAAPDAECFVPGVTPDAQGGWGIQSRVWCAADGGGYTLEALIPWSVVELTEPPEAGRKLRFDICIDDSESGSGRRAQLAWSGGIRNSADRTYWGMLMLVE